MSIVNNNGHSGGSNTLRDSFASSLFGKTAEPRQTVIGEEVRLVGTLHSSAEVLITGHVEGNVECPALIVGPNGWIEGNVTANSVIMRGEITGDINAGDVLLQEQSRVSGDISYHLITIEHGAKFEGSVQHIDQPEYSSKPAGPSSDKSAVPLAAVLRPVRIRE